MTDLDLDALLTSARDVGPVPSPALMDRVLADAAALQPHPASVARVVAPVVYQPAGWLEWLAAVFGGGGALAGVSLALLAGVFIGVVQPEPVLALTQALLVEGEVGTVDLLPTTTDLWEEQAND